MENGKENNVGHGLSLNTIYCGDCLELMKKLPNEYIDLTVTSPPYDNLRTYNGYSRDFEGIAKELYHKTKRGGVVVWIVGDATIKGSETGTSFRQALYFKECGFNLHDTMIYEKINPVPINDNRYQQCWEYMFIFSKGRPKTFNPIKRETLGVKPGNFYRKDGTLKEGNKKASKEYKINNIFRYSVGGQGLGHPAIFPEKLAEDHILSWSNEGDIVLDPFMGSGTTGKMALINNRNFIGFEISQEYVDIANKRIQDRLLEK